MAIERVRIAGPVLDGILDAARLQYPKEFFCLLGGRRGEGEVLVDEIVYIPFKNSERSASFNILDIPNMDPRIVGSAHSHPVPSGPSPADLQTFPYAGWVHLIVYPPFDRTAVSAYDAKGRLIPLLIED